MADLAAALRELHPNLTPATLGGHDVFHFRTVTAADVFESVVGDIGGGRLAELTARDSFHKRLAGFLLDRVAEVDLPGLQARTIRVLPVTFPRPWRFESVVVAPPRVAKRFEHESAALRRITYWA